MGVSLYEWLVLFHIVTAAVWIGGAVYGSAVAALVKRSDDPQDAVRHAGYAEWVNGRVIAPAAAVLVITGMAAVAEGPWEYSQAWISIGFLVWVIGFGIGAAFYTPQYRQVRQLAKRLGPGSDQVRSRLRTITMVSHIELVLVVIAVFAMVTKPGL